MLEIKKYRIGYLYTNVYFIFDSESREAVIIDPAAMPEKIIKIVDELDIKPIKIFLTHGHMDHMLAAEEISKHYNIDIYAGENELELLKDPVGNLSRRFRCEMTLLNVKTFKDSETFKLFGRIWHVLSTPGHTGGSLSYYIEETSKENADGILISGDTLFKESYGRTDFPSGSEEDIIKSIVLKLLVLPESTKVYPGHEDTTTIEHERKYNPAVHLYRMRGFDA